jgi:RES domain-containing protein
MAVASIDPELKHSFSPERPKRLSRNIARVPPSRRRQRLRSILSDLIRSLTCQKASIPLVWDPKWAEWDCHWRKIVWIDHKTSASWLLSDIAITEGCKGIFFPSLQHAGGTNLVVFSANLDAGDSVEVHGPDGRLPKDQSSWP